MYTLDKAINCAKREALRKQLVGKLFSACDDSEASQDFTDGDPETLYSIASMYSQFVEDTDVDVAEDKILDALINEFPDYV
jgi:hypothetical protein